MEKNKKFRWEASSNIRDMVKKMNELGIQQKDVVFLGYNEQYILVYWG